MNLLYVELQLEMVLYHFFNKIKVSFEGPLANLNLDIGPSLLGNILYYSSRPAAIVHKKEYM